ncbi:MAG TPA: damage-inducible protein, partial [Pseudonocardiaceae bacterium]|nr:damage-inducible protein [Pseudonocardiaceae bacterium]
MFSPQGVEKVSRERLVFAVRPGEPLPWEPDHELARRKLRSNQAWRHVVYLGIYRLDEVFEILSRVFTSDQESFDERPAGESAVAAFVVGGDGCALNNSEVLSSCAWATGQVSRKRRGRQDWLSGFDGAAKGFRDVWPDLVNDYRTFQQDDGTTQEVMVPRTLRAADLSDCLYTAVDMAGIGTALRCAEIRIKSQIVAKRTADNAGGHEFLNSFIMDDLDHIAERAAKGDLGAALRGYLRPDAEIPTARRVNVRDQVGAVLAATAPDTVPAGRWPRHPEHALALNQQLAVNTVMQMTDTGVLGVNGPPGTGKTTMLRDLIAALVVERAQKLAALPDPKKAFSGQRLRWSTGERTRVVSAWRSDLTGFEMVVASSNNGAVQNVTDEIPAADAIDESWREQAAEVGYFPEIATALLAPETDAEAGQSAGAQGWALVAARLGNKANRGRFASAFWYGSLDGSADGQRGPGLLSTLQGYEQATPERPWSAAVADFRAAQARVSTIRAQRSKVHQAPARRARMHSELAELRRSVVTAGEQVERARERHRAVLRVERERQIEAERIAKERQAEIERIAEERRADAAQVARSWAAELDRRWQAHARHRESQPGLWERVRTFGAGGRRWSQQDEWLANEVRAAQHELDAAQRVRIPEETRAQPPYEPLLAARRELALAEQEVNTAVSAQKERECRLRASEAELTTIDRLLDDAAAALGKHYP